MKTLVGTVYSGQSDITSGKTIHRRAQMTTPQTGYRLQFSLGHYLESFECRVNRKPLKKFHQTRTDIRQSENIEFRTIWTLQLLRPYTIPRLGTTVFSWMAYPPESVHIERKTHVRLIWPDKLQDRSWNTR